MPDGTSLLVRDWPVPDARDAVLFVHGLSEHSGRYRQLAQWFNRRGFHVRAYDQRGHGHSEGQHGALRRRDDLLADLATVWGEFAASRPRAPLLLGHSMGGLVALRAVLDGRVRPSALVLSSPALRTHEPAWLIRLARVLAHLAPRLPLRSALGFEFLTHNQRVLATYRRDPLRHGWITPRLADFLFRAGPACIADASRLDLPTLLLVSGADHIVDPAGSHAFADAASADPRLTTRYFAGLYHELFNEAEPGRGQVLKQLDQWLAARRHAAP